MSGLGPGNVTVVLTPTAAELEMLGLSVEGEEGRLKSFSDAYGSVHGPLVLGICVFGVAANLINVLVLSRRKLRQCPTNFLLCGLSIAQLLLLLNFLCYSLYSSSLAPGPCSLPYKSFGWLAYLVLNVNVNVVLHSTALAHTTLLAVFRYLAVHFPNKFYSTLHVLPLPFTRCSAHCLINAASEDGRPAHLHHLPHPLHLLLHQRTHPPHSH